MRCWHSLYFCFVCSFKSLTQFFTPTLEPFFSNYQTRFRSFGSNLIFKRSKKRLCQKWIQVTILWAENSALDFVFDENGQYVYSHISARVSKLHDECYFTSKVNIISLLSLDCNCKLLPLHKDKWSWLVWTCISRGSWFAPQLLFF